MKALFQERAARGDRACQHLYRTQQLRSGEGHTFSNDQATGLPDRSFNQTGDVEARVGLLWVDD